MRDETEVRDLVQATVDRWWAERVAGSSLVSIDDVATTLRDAVYDDGGLVERVSLAAAAADTFDLALLLEEWRAARIANTPVVRTDRTILGAFEGALHGDEGLVARLRAALPMQGEG